jgi:hypothetical protein
MIHPSVYHRCASEVDAEILRARRRLNTALASRDWAEVQTREVEIAMLVERAVRFRRLALIATLWPIIVLVAVALIIAALAALAVLP